MKTLLYTGWDKLYQPLADITVPRMLEYAARHRLDFAPYPHTLLDVPNGIYWTGVCGALRAFEEGYERVIYLDVDQLITNFEFVLPEWGYGFHASKDWGEDAIEPWQFSMCGFVAHHDSVSLLRKVLSMEPEWREKPFAEQGPFQDVVKNFVSGSIALPSEVPAGLINFHGRKMFNCVPEAVCPGKVPEPWVKGDWCCHLTMISLDERVKLAKEIVATL